MSSSAPAVTSPGTHEGDTTLALATPVPYSSDGPTLPLLDGPSEHDSGSGATGVATNPNSSREKHNASKDEERTSKKRKTPTAAPDAVAPPKAHSKMDDNTTLFTPWTLLPREVLSAVEGRLGSGGGGVERVCVPVVYTKNQNVASGVNRLKAYLGFDTNTGSTMDAGVGEKLGGRDVLIAVSAQGEGTTKLVGIVDVALRVVGGEAQGTGTEKAEAWFLYTSLTSRVVSASKHGSERDAMAVDGPDADEDGFETKRKPDGREAEVKSRKIPVLTAWLSKQSIPEFKTAFGERSFEVRTVQVQG